MAPGTNTSTAAVNNKVVETEAPKQSTPINPLDATDEKKPKGPSILKNIVTAETSDDGEKILEEAPEIDLSLVQDIIPPKSVLLLVLKTLFGILVIASFVSVIFFTSQLSNRLTSINSTFGVPNVSKDLSSSNSEITKLQTKLNLYRYLQIKAYLDEFSFYGDSYLKSYEVANSQTAENSEVKDALEEMAYLKDYLKESFTNAKELIVKTSTAPLFSTDLKSENDLEFLFEEQLVKALNDKASELYTSSDTQDKRDYKNYIHTTNLVGNDSLRSLLIKTDFDSLTEEELYDFIKGINAVIVNDLSVIQKIKDNRIRWSDIINEIKLRTIAVDDYYVGDFYNELGGIRYTSYDFDSGGPSISIVGETKTLDTKNFTMIVDLIDELNESGLFKNGEMKSFSKSGSLDSGYTASIKLNLGLEGMGTIEEEMPVDELPSLGEMGPPM